jgi:hypothetical protein
VAKAGVWYDEQAIAAMLEEMAGAFAKMSEPADAPCGH